MWLESHRQHNLTWNDPKDLIVPCRVDVWANVDFETNDPEPGQPESFIVGRLLADEIRRFDIEEHGINAWDAADADSSGTEAAWAALLDEHGRFREEGLESMGDPAVYVYRFHLHPDFAECRMAVIDAFCRQFGNDALVLFQYHTTMLSETEFEELGFKDLPPAKFRGQSAFAGPTQEVRFKMRNNSNVPPFRLADYPEDDDLPGATAKHAEWLVAQGPWELV